MNTTKEKDLMDFETKWLEEENIDFIEDKIETNLEKLFQHEKYAEISETFSALNLKLLSSLDENQRNLFHSYQNIALKLNSYQNTLAYYLGFHEKKK